jgi:hypothetical protein
MLRLTIALLAYHARHYRLSLAAFVERIWLFEQPPDLANALACKPVLLG